MWILGIPIHISWIGRSAIMEYPIRYSVILNKEIGKTYIASVREENLKFLGGFGRNVGREKRDKQRKLLSSVTTFVLA